MRISAFIPPTAPPPRPVRPLFRMLIATLKPLPTSPSTFSGGTRTSANDTDAVDEARMPILSSWGPRVTPGQAVSTMKAVILPSGPSVRANTVQRSAIPPLVIQIFSPFRIQAPSSPRFAEVRIDAASEPAPGSVRQNAAISSPVASRGR